MIDREKVVKKLAVRIQSDSEEWNSIELSIEEAKDILVLLKEQEPKNVIAEKRRVLFDDSGDESWYYEDVFYHCPSCNRILSRTHMKKNIHFCEDCGQAVMWECD